MADDHSQRPYRSSETIARSGQPRGAASAAGGSDPLAELARLIGQTDPFGDLGKEPRRVAAAPQPAADWAAPPQQPSAPPVAPHFAHEDPAPYQQPSADLYQVEQEVPSYLTQQRAPAYDPHGYHQGAAHEDAYDDVPAPRRRIGVMAIAGIFALAVIGTAGAFGYRAVFGGSGTRMPPPVIKADTAPSKIVPDTAAKDSNKLITERVGSGADEKMISREEKPVDIKDKIATPVFPPVTATGQPPQAGPALASAGNGVVGGEPKKVHTITIRPDQPMVADATPQAPAPRQASPIAMPEPQPARAAAPPLAPARPQPQAAAHEPAPRPAPAPPARSANAPLSLNPDAAPAPAPRAPTRTASTAPTSLAATPSANLASAARGGGYAVQVSSQRSEAEAQSAYRAIQGKYGSVLGGHSMFVHKVELGAKGTYYRAMVGPFGSQAEASQLCSSLKSAGGSCLVQRN
ncbi:MAG TPA: SPOR domain-containing protein [Pseudolabrys sp.]|nr:SPOR domain-containing protein [Pseudolabrys sp.]